MRDHRETKNDLHKELTKLFIKYQRRLDHPMPEKISDFKGGLELYRNDWLFHEKVSTLVQGTMMAIEPCIDSMLLELDAVAELEAKLDAVVDCKDIIKSCLDKERRTMTDHIAAVPTCNALDKALAAIEALQPDSGEQKK